MFLIFIGLFVLSSLYRDALLRLRSSTKADLVEKVDSYLNYVVESWMEENQIAIQNGLRTEIAETFIALHIGCAHNGVHQHRTMGQTIRARQSC